MAWLLALWAGVAATAVITWIGALARWNAATRFHPARFLGCLARPGARGAPAAGWLLYVAGGCFVLPLLYTAAFEAIGEADAVVGCVLGLVHGLAAGAALPFAGRPNPCLRANDLAAPGLFGHRLGSWTPIGFLGLHILYGGLLGYIYAIPPA